MPKLAGVAAVALAALALSGAPHEHAAAPRQFHRDVLVRCYPDNSGGAYEAEVLIHNGKEYATGLIRGFTIQAVTRTGTVMHLTVTEYFKVPPNTQWGFFREFPHHVSSCTAQIRWVH